LSHELRFVASVFRNTNSLQPLPNVDTRRSS
jgi:hypothetical protein